MSFVEFHDVKKIYRMGEIEIHALRDVNFRVEKGEFCVVVGASGAGKTTILNILGGMDTLSEGSVWLDGKEISAYNKRQLTEYRRYDIGFVFQFYNLVPELTAWQNIVLPLNLDGRRPDAEYLNAVVETLGLTERLGHFAGELSGGQQQRVAIARALASKPAVILADEPTGNLDSKSSRAVIRSFQQARDALEATIFMVTHDSFAASFCDRVVILRDGVVWRTLEKGATDRTAFQDQLLDAIRDMGKE